MENLFSEMQKNSLFFLGQMNTAQDLFSGVSKYNNEFLIPYLIAAQYFSRAEWLKISQDCNGDGIKGTQWEDYLSLFELNMNLMSRSLESSIQAINDVAQVEFKNFINALYNSFSPDKGDNLADFFRRQAEMISGVSQSLPQSVKEVESEFGFHFERQKDALFDETDRFLLYRVLPTDPGVSVDKRTKPLLILPPYVLGCNILSFLPAEKKSYAHSYANQGIPTYIRVMKDISATPALQTMTMEDDAKDTRYFCEKVMKEHDKKVTLNGYCQGGFSAVCNILSDELDGCVDALITCVAPMDGTRSRGLGTFLERLPDRFNDLLYGTKTLPNGNEVADGQLMAWVYKLKSIEDQTPVVAFLRDMLMVDQMKKKSSAISKTAAAINYWLQNERSDIPLPITRMSFASYNIPVSEDGTLPVKIFGKTLNFKGIPEKNIPWLLCYGENDDLVEKEVALAPLDYIEVEATPFPKGHIAIATSWSHPESPFALHTRFGPDKEYRGPVRFQLDLNEAMDKARDTEVKAAKASEAEAKKAKAKKAEQEKKAQSRKKTSADSKARPAKKKAGTKKGTKNPAQSPKRPPAAKKAAAIKTPSPKGTRSSES